jgi:hypothetical protein
MKSDEAFYEAVVIEIEREGPRKGLWAKAFAKAGGVEPVAKACYIEWRVEQLKDEIAAELAAQLARAEDAARKQAEFDKEQENLRERAELQRQSSTQYPAFVRLAKKILSVGFSRENVEGQLELRGLPRELAVRAVREASNGHGAI